MKNSFVWVAMLLFAASCTNDQLPEPMLADCGEGVPTYEVEVRPIIEATCAYSGCHLGSAPGIYDSYEGLLPSLEDNSFRERVISQRANPTVGMPPNYAPEGRAEDLTEEELNIIECWLEAGYPEE
ncbi:MAG: hypothetical protein AAGJ82_12070 [Bacteroidota bacterium]